MAPLRTNSTSTKQCHGEPLPFPLWKRAIDITCCLAASPFLAIGTLFVAMLMSVTSPGPIFFRQERVGFMGRRFRLYKFRTMHVGTDTSSHQSHFAKLRSGDVPMQKLDAKGDSRLIPCGWLIRAAGLDELPQILNIVRGEMSLVGPRPCIPYEFESYTIFQRGRFRAAPGLTGLWQVSGKNRTTFDRMIELDLQYAAERSLKLDLRIMLMTCPAIFSQIAEMCRLRRAPATYVDRPLLGKCAGEPVSIKEEQGPLPTIRTS